MGTSWRDTEDWKFDYEWYKKTRYGFDLMFEWTCKHCGETKTTKGCKPPTRKCNCRKETTKNDEH